MKSFWSGRGCLFAVALLAAGSGAVLQLEASPPGGNGIPKTVDATSQDGTGSALITDFGDGTALVLVIGELPNGDGLSAFAFGVTDFSTSSNLRPGQSGRGVFSGEGHATVDGFTFDGVDFTPVVIGIEMTVTGAENLAMTSQQGVTATPNESTGETIVVRIHQMGNQAWGLTAGSLTLTVDGDVVHDSTGGWGSLRSFIFSVVEQIH